MNLVLRVCWLALAVVHIVPAAVLVRPDLIERLYAISPTGPSGVLLAHRGAAFLALAIIAAWAAFDPAVRRLGSIALAVSVVGFLILYLRAGSPAALRSIAIADLVALLPLAVVTWAAWRAQP